MRLYRAVWWTLVSLLAVFGVVMVGARLGGPVLAPLAVWTVLIGLVLPAARQRRTGPGQQAPRRLALLGRALRSSVLVTLGSVALVCLVASVDAAIFALALLLAAASPGALEWYRSTGRQPLRHQARQRRPEPQPSAPYTNLASEDAEHRGATGAEERAARTMTVDELCRAWRSSYPRLQKSLSAERRARCVEARRQYLDEMERRDPVAFGRWLQDGARAASDPSKYLSGK